jgi:hypothetical protein
MPPTLVGKIPSNPSFAEFCSYLGVDQVMAIRRIAIEEAFGKTYPNLEETLCMFQARSAERHQPPKPDIVRGRLYFENRKCTTAKSISFDVVIELGRYPRTCVYLADGYSLVFSIIKDKRCDLFTPNVGCCGFDAAIVGGKGYSVARDELPLVTTRMSDTFGINKCEIAIVD